MTPKPTALIIDDEIQIQRLVRVTLESNGFNVDIADTARAGLAQAAVNHPDVVILDLGLPDADGVTVLRDIRGWSNVPVVILSARSEEHDIIGCLDAGADDYLVKPFRPGELLARLRNALRHRPETTQPALVTVGAVSIDLASMTVKKNGVLVKLTDKEYALLALFVRNSGKLLTHRYILEQVWGSAFAEETQYTRVYVSQLRKKIEDDPANPTLLVTESGIGYRFIVDDPTQ